MSGEQHVPEDMTALVRRFKALGFAGHRADQLAVEVRDSLWLAKRDEQVRALPDREAVERHVRAAVCGCGGGADAHPVERDDQIVEPIAQRVSDAVLALFGQEGQR